MDRDELESIAIKVRDVCRSSGFERRLAVGKLVLDGVFGGSVADWQERRSSKHVSLRRLARLVSGAISKSELHRSVATYLLCQRLPFVPTSGHLTVSHVEAVEGAAPQAQEMLLSKAAAAAWTVRQLRQAKFDLLGGRGRTARSARLARAVKAFGQSARLATELARCIEVSSVDAASNKLGEISRAMEELLASCRTLRAALEHNSSTAPRSAAPPSIDSAA